MSVIAIKLEMAELSLKANRFEEAEKTVMDVILDPSTDSESQYSAFIALGSIKMIRLLNRTAIFSEVEYCYKKAFVIKPNEFTADLYLHTLSHFLRLATEAITLSQKRIKDLQIKFGIDILVTFASAYTLNQRGNTLLTNVVGLIGLDYGVNGIIGDLNTIDDFENLIKYLKSNINEVVEKYNNPSLPLNEKQIEYFEDELIRNKIKEISKDKINQLDINSKVELLFKYFDESIDDDINLRLHNKLKVVASLNGKDSMTMMLNGLKNHRNALRKYFDESCLFIYWGMRSIGMDEYNIIFTENNIQILVVEKTFSFKTEPKEIIKIEYKDFFANKIVVKTEKDEQEIKIQLPNNSDIGIISFKSPFKSSTKNKQIEMIKKMTVLFNNQ